MTEIDPDVILVCALIIGLIGYLAIEWHRGRPGRKLARLARRSRER